MRSLTQPLQVGESVETATVREVKEETNLDLTALEQVGRGLL